MSVSRQKCLADPLSPSLFGAWQGVKYEVAKGLDSSVGTALV